MGGTIPQPRGPELYKKVAECESENKPAIKPASMVPHGFCFKLPIEFLPHDDRLWPRSRSEINHFLSMLLLVRILYNRKGIRTCGGFPNHRTIR